jgi:translation initiation factor IF-1
MRDLSAFESQEPQSLWPKTHIKTGKIEEKVEDDVSCPRKRKWTREEDAVLLELVNNNGKQWSLIANLIGNRNARQCRERWNHYLCGEYEKRKWIAEEDKILVEKFKEIGPKWSIISGNLEKRSSIDVRNRYAVLKRKNKNSGNFRCRSRKITRVKRQNILEPLFTSGEKDISNNEQLESIFNYEDLPNSQSDYQDDFF